MLHRIILCVIQLNLAVPIVFATKECPRNCEEGITAQQVCRGEECTTGCKHGWFGISCDMKCSQNCTDNICDQHDGSCTRGCLAGRYGVTCSQECSSNCKSSCARNGECDCTDGHYGPTCQYSCPKYCKDNVCHAVSFSSYPECPDGCTDGYWGRVCEQFCSHRCVRCNRENGDCEECISGYFGTNCTKCSPYCMDGECEHDGSCTVKARGRRYVRDAPVQDTAGCISKKDGRCICCYSQWSGSNCTQPCPTCLSRYSPNAKDCDLYCKDGYYGDMCNVSCPQNCRRGHAKISLCVKADGNCPNCVTGFWGPKCENKCSEKCKDFDCFQKDGQCLACRDNKRYGMKCEDLCPRNCLDKTCHHQNGTCLKCLPFFAGDQCEQRCSDTCQDGRCLISQNGSIACPGDCSDGFMGRSCREKCPEQCITCEKESGRCLTKKDALTAGMSATTEHAAPDTTTTMLLAVLLPSMLISLGAHLFCFFKFRRQLSVSKCFKRGRAKPNTPTRTCTIETETSSLIEKPSFSQTISELPGSEIPDLFGEVYKVVRKVEEQQKHFEEAMMKLKQFGCVTIIGPAGTNRLMLAWRLCDTLKGEDTRSLYVENISHVDMKPVNKEGNLILICNETSENAYEKLKIFVDHIRKYTENDSEHSSRKRRLIFLASKSESGSDNSVKKYLFKDEVVVLLQEPVNGSVPNEIC